MHTIAGRLFALVTAACWAHNSVVYGLAGKRVGSGAVTHIRLWIAVPVMLIVHMVAFRRLVPPASLEALILLASSGFLGFFVADILIFRAFVDLGHRETLVILTLSPLFAAIISWIVLAERLAAAQIMGMCVTIGGIVWLIVAEGHGEEARSRGKGVLYAILGAAAQAAGMVLAKQGMSIGDAAGGAMEPLSANLIRLTAGLIGVGLFRATVGSFGSDFRAMRDRKALVLIGQGAVIGPVFGIIMNLYALSLAPVGVVTTIMQISPIMLLPVDRLIFRKRLPFGAYGGTVLAVAGAAVLFVF